MLLSLKRKNIKLIRVLSVMVVPIAFFITNLQTSSLQMNNRSISISSAVPSAVVTNDFRFNIPSTNAIGSIVFEYCDNSPVDAVACSAPAGFDALGSTLTGQTFNVGFSEDIPSSTANRLVLSRPSSPGIIGISSYTISGIVNPSSSNQTVYVRMSTHASSDGTGPSIDIGSIAFSTSRPGFNIGAYVPPYITFCTGQFVSIDCSTSTGTLTSFGELSESSTSSVTTQMSVATNDFTGYNIFVSGQTLTSGNNIINAISTTTPSNVGQSQFGMNLRQNNSPTVGTNPSGVGTGLVAAGYNTQNQYKFTDGDRVAYSPISSDFTRFTASYIANVPPSQPPGIYATTLTYMAVVSF